MKTFVVLGAGVAGLAAAEKLTSQGHRVILLEARDRIGGRIHSETMRNGTIIDMGANWKECLTGHPMDQFQTGITTADDNEESLVAYRDGQEMGDMDLYNLMMAFNELEKKVRELARQKSTPVTMAQLFEEAFDKLPQASRADKDLLRQRFNEQYASWHGEQIDKISSEILTTKSSDFPGKSMLPHYGPETALVTNGFGKFTDALETKCQRNRGQFEVLLEHEVTQVDSQGKHPIVRCKNLKTNEQSEFACDGVICTLPAGVLKRLTSNTQTPGFVPAWPKDKAQALNRIQTGVLNKVFLSFDNCFWDNDTQYLYFVKSGATAANSCLNLACPEWRVNKNTLVFLFEGDEARFNADDPGVVENCMRLLRETYGNGIPAPSDTKVTRWHEDPYACGSWSVALAKGERPKDKQVVAKPLLDRKVTMAGEHTAYHGANVHGSFCTGVDAAETLEKHLKASPDCPNPGKVQVSSKVASTSSRSTSTSAKATTSQATSPNSIPKRTTSTSSLSQVAAQSGLDGGRDATYQPAPFQPKPIRGANNPKYEKLVDKLLCQHKGVIDGAKLANALNRLNDPNITLSNGSTLMATLAEGIPHDLKKLLNVGLDLNREPNYIHKTLNGCAKHLKGEAHFEYYADLAEVMSKEIPKDFLFENCIECFRKSLTVDEGHIELLKQFKDKGIDITRVDKNGKTILGAMADNSLLSEDQFKEVAAKVKELGVTPTKADIPAIESKLGKGDAQQFMREAPSTSYLSRR